MLQCVYGYSDFLEACRHGEVAREPSETPCGGLFEKWQLDFFKCSANVTMNLTYLFSCQERDEEIDTTVIFVHQIFISQIDSDALQSAVSMRVHI